MKTHTRVLSALMAALLLVPSAPTYADESATASTETVTEATSEEQSSSAQTQSENTATAESASAASASSASSAAPATNETAAQTTSSSAEETPSDGGSSEQSATNASESTTQSSSDSSSSSSNETAESSNEQASVSAASTSTETAEENSSTEASSDEETADTSEQSSMEKATATSTEDTTSADTDSSTETTESESGKSKSGESESSTELTTDDATSDTTADTDESATESSTETSTESSTESATEDSTESATEEVTEASTESATEEATESSTEATTEEADEDTTESITEETDEETTEDSTESTTEEAVEDATESATESSTEELTADDVIEEKEGTVTFSGVESVTIEAGTVFDLMSGVSATVEYADGTTKDLTPYLESVTDADGGVALNGTVITAEAGDVYTVIYGVDSFDASVKRTITVEEDEFVASVTYTGVDDIETEPDAEINLLDGVKATYVDQDGTEQEAVVSVQSITANGEEVDASDALTTEADTEYIVTYANDVTDETAERKITVTEESQAVVTYTGIDDIEADPDEEINLLDGVKATYVDQDGAEQEAVVSIQAITANGEDVEISDVLTTKSETEYIVTYANDVTDETAERKITVKSQVDVTYTGIDDIEADPDEEINLLDGVKATYVDEDGAEQEAVISIQSIFENNEEVEIADTLTAEANAEYIVTYANDVSDETAERKITVSDYDVTFEGTDDATIEAMQDFDLLDGVTASYESNGEKVEAEVTVQSVTDADGVELSDAESNGAYLNTGVLINPAGEAVYTVVYGNDKTEQTVERTLTVESEYVHELSTEIDGVTITVECDDDVFKKGYTLSAEVSDNQKDDRTIVKQALKNKKHLDHLYVYNLVIEDEDGNGVKIDADMTVSFDGIEKEDAETYAVYQIQDDTAEELGIDTAEVQTNSLSGIGVCLLSKMNYITRLETDCDGMTIVLTCDDGIIPEGSTAVAGRCDPETSPEYVSAVEEKVKSSDSEGAEITSVALYDVTIYDEDGDEVQLDNESVQITIQEGASDMEDGEDLSVYHFVGGDASETEQLNATVDGEDVSFSTSSF